MTEMVVVDDEEGVRRSLLKILEKDGYHVHLAENGRQAIDLVSNKGQAIETVISDYKMPGIDGLETLIAIGRINPEITRIMLTGYATMESAINAVNNGIDGFLTKPFDNNELKAKIREYMINKRLKQFVSEQILLEMHRKGGNLRPHLQKVSIIFADIRNFTAMVETMAPEDLAEILNNRFFSPLDTIIYESDGILDKHIGDNIMSVFGAPIPTDDHALKAVTSALKMRKVLNFMNNNEYKTEQPLTIGIGISTGEALAGIFGSSRKKEYTVMGSLVNLAARLEHLALPGQILICEETHRQVREHVRCEKIAPTPIKGISHPINIYSVLDAP